MKQVFQPKANTGRIRRKSKGSNDSQTAEHPDASRWLSGDTNSLVSPDGQVDAATLAAQGLEVFDEASLKSPNAGIEKLYPGVLAMYE